MTVLFRRLLALPAAAVFAGVLATAHAQQPSPSASQRQSPSTPQRHSDAPPGTGAATPESLARGAYIVEHIAQCWRCHSPLDASGQRDRTQWLMGAPVDTRPTRKGVEWALYAPRIAGSPAGTGEQFIRLMMTGVKRNGEVVKQPMPQFHMTREDAEAVLAYVRSLGHGAAR